MGASKPFLKGGTSYYTKVNVAGAKPRQVPLKTRDFREAEHMVERINIDIGRGRYRLPDADESPSLDRFAKLYEAYYLNAGGRELRSSREASWRADHHQFEGIIAYLKKRGAKRANQATKALAFDYRDWRLSQDPPPSVETVKKCARLACAAWNWAIAKGYATVNPWAEMPFPKSKRKDPRNLSVFELRRIMPDAEANEDQLIHRAMALALYSGPRLGEVLALDWSDLTWGASGSIRIAAGKGREPRSTLFPPELQAILEPHKQRIGPIIHVSGKDARQTGEWIEKRVAMVRKRTGVKFCFHDLRRTFARLLADRGVPPTKLQALLGHASLQTTLTYYVGKNSDITAADGALLALGLGSGSTSGSESSAKAV